VDKLRLALRERRRGSDHLGSKPLRGDADDELPGGLDVDEGVLGTPIRFRSRNADGKSHGIVTGDAEVGEGGDIVFAILRDRRNDGDGPGDNCAGQEFVAMADSQVVRRDFHGEGPFMSIST
jgi:hypothetical protein